jgi:hypothetical protein
MFKESIKDELAIAYRFKIQQIKGLKQKIRAKP